MRSASSRAGPPVSACCGRRSKCSPRRRHGSNTRALVDLGAALRRGNSRREARELLREGVELAHRCGANALVERANEELAATGARPRTILLSGVDALTASERRVAHMAAEELSNKEIAQALFVTVKTVEVHLSARSRRRVPRASYDFPACSPPLDPAASPASSSAKSSRPFPSAPAIRFMVHSRVASPVHGL